jgi:RNA polymerase sigma-32 factor
MQALVPHRNHDVSTDSFGAYLDQVHRMPFLTEEQEDTAAKAWFEDQDRPSADLLLTAHLRLVVSIARKYQRQWPNMFDLVQEGNVGLMEALYRYDPYRENRFSSYAKYWIRAMILRFLLDNWSLVKVTNTRAGRKLFFQLQKERDLLESEGINPTAALIAKRLDVSEEEVVRVSGHLDNAVLALDAPAGEDRTLADVIELEGPSPEAQTARNQLNEVVGEYIAKFGKTLEGRELAVWEQRLVADVPTGLKELGVQFGVTKQRVSQIERGLKNRLKEMLERDLGGEIDLM